MGRARLVFAAIAIVFAGGMSVFSSLMSRRAQEIQSQVAAGTWVPQAASADDPEGQERQRAQKLGRYAVCVDYIRVARVRDAYFAWADPAAGIPADARPRHLPALGGNVAQCVSTVQEAARLPPAIPELEAAGIALGAALGVLEPQLEEARRYYEREDWRTDGFAHGLEIHPALSLALARAAEAQRTLSDVLEREQHALSLARIARLEARPDRGVELRVERLMVSADDFLAALRDPVVADPEAVDPAAAARLSALADRVRTAADDLTAYAAAHRAEADAMWASQLLGECDDFVRNTRIRALQLAGDPAARHDRGLGNEQVISAYNDLVSGYNALRR